jgi:hypothetical protein
MFLGRLFKVSGVLATAILLLFALTPAASLSQDVPTSEELLAEQSLSEPIEEIIVYGDKSLYHYRLEMYRAQDLVFTTFNSINSDDQYDVHCYDESAPGSRVKRHICRASFVKEAEAAEAMGFMLGHPHVPAKTVIFQKHSELTEELDKLMLESPELREAVIKYGITIQNLEAARKEKCDGRTIACRK